jgi:hypothetical protein
MTADKTLTKDEFAEKYCQEWDAKYGWIKSDCVYDNILSDLNALLRNELIKYDKWCESQSTAVLILLNTEELVDKYLKSEQQ